MPAVLRVVEQAARLYRGTRRLPHPRTLENQQELNRLDGAIERLSPLRERLLAHDLYAAIDSSEAVCVFMEHHVFAVWDFMSLLKAIQRRLTCLDVPWTPQGDRVSRRFINEMVLGEESDDDGGGGFTSHFELYLAAMRQAGARTDRIDQLVDLVGRGVSVDAALDGAEAPAAARRFVLSTFGVIASGSLPAVAAAFTLGREQVIPDMFRALVVRLDDGSPGRFGLLRQYLERHVDIDEHRHAPMARNLRATLGGDDQARWAEAERAATQALEARLALWDGALQQCQARHARRA